MALGGEVNENPPKKSSQKVKKCPGDNVAQDNTNSVPVSKGEL